jgi:hypothetical protein
MNQIYLYIAVLITMVVYFCRCQLKESLDLVLPNEIKKVVGETDDIYIDSARYNVVQFGTKLR